MTESIRLPHKPDVPLSYWLTPGRGPISATHLVVFLNGLIMPQTGWRVTVEELRRRWGVEDGADHPPMLTYDRYGQGESGRDPADESNDGTHDILEIVHDLRKLVREVWRTRIAPALGHGREGVGEGASERGKGRPPPSLVFVGNSLGCVIARLYASTYPGAAAALLLLDSNMANSDLVSVFPDPDAAGFDAGCLPADVTVADLRRTRANYAAAFHPSVPNPEHLDRRGIAALLPHADRPALEGPPPLEDDDGHGGGGGGGGPWITVVGHDWEAFAEEGLRGPMNVPKSLTNAFMNPAWSQYNEGLVRLTEEARARGPLTAPGCGHFIQRDDPVLVAELVQDLLHRVETAEPRKIASPST
ncbi:alpha/beta-hydrolase [Durotheca rogersii]|uniref:alpha/beta-hydrolase n=1 Tax=Durotheca rogersii TaxID=419775 RepID=UPI00221E3D37|nr:alpha/beta-hydrolase [Durotheca rogersii]KAI5866770.1 alpha/beta-hydrolase [Durotheca rogersii]